MSTAKPIDNNNLWLNFKSIVWVKHILWNFKIINFADLWSSTETFWSANWVIFMIWPWKFDSRLSIRKFKSLHTSQSEYKSKLIFSFGYLAFPLFISLWWGFWKFFLCCREATKVKVAIYLVFLRCQPNQTLKRKSVTNQSMQNLFSYPLFKSY